jgi:hypothetical protein
VKINLQYLHQIASEWPKRFRLITNSNNEVIKDARLDVKNNFNIPLNYTYKDLRELPTDIGSFISLPTACNMLFFKLVYLLRDKLIRQTVLQIIPVICPFIKLYIEHAMDKNPEAFVGIIMYYFRAGFCQLESLKEPLSSNDKHFKIQILAVCFDMLKSFSELTNVCPVYIRIYIRLLQN